MMEKPMMKKRLGILSEDKVLRWILFNTTSPDVLTALKKFGRALPFLHKDEYFLAVSTLYDYAEVLGYMESLNEEKSE